MTTQNIQLIPQWELLSWEKLSYPQLKTTRDKYWALMIDAREAHEFEYERKYASYYDALKRLVIAKQEANELR